MDNNSATTWVEWKLDEPRPWQGDVWFVLRDWFKRSKSLQEALEDADRPDSWLMPALNRFRKLDVLARDADNAGKQVRKPWRSWLAKRLLVIKDVLYRRFAAGGLGSEASAPLWHGWNWAMCRPSAGLWSGKIHGPNRAGVAGKPCRFWLCPWCWMRQWDDYKKVLTYASNQQVTVAGSRKLSGMGLLPPFKVTEYHGPPVNAFNADDWNRVVEELIRRRPGGRGLGPECKQGLRLLNPVGVFNPDTRIHEFRWCTSLIHNGHSTGCPELDGDMRSSDFNPGLLPSVNIVRRAFATVEEAWREANRWPAEFLELPPEDAGRLAYRMFDRRRCTIIRPQQLKPRKTGAGRPTLAERRTIMVPDIVFGADEDFGSWAEEDLYS